MDRWHPTHSGKLRIRSWDGEESSVVFDVISGDTHLLDDLSLELVGLIDAQPATTSELAHKVADHFADGYNDEQIEFVQASLLQLQSVGLVARNTP